MPALAFTPVLLSEALVDKGSDLVVRLKGNRCKGEGHPSHAGA